MEAPEKKVAVSIMKPAAYTALAMAVFFLLMKLLRLNTFVELHFLNFVILLIGIRYILLRSRMANSGKLEYLSGMLTGFTMAFYTSVVFSVFMLLYLSIDSTFMEYLKATQPFGSYLTPGFCALIALIEGTAGGAILAFSLMHLYNSDNAQG